MPIDAVRVSPDAAQVGSSKARGGRTCFGPWEKIGRGSGRIGKTMLPTVSRTLYV